MKTYIINTASGTLVDTLDGASTLSGLAPDLVAIQRADDQPCDINTLVTLALVESVAAQKSRIIAELDMRDAQRRRYIRIGLSTTDVDIKIAALDAQMAALPGQ